MSDINKLSTELTISRLRELQKSAIGGPNPEWLVTNGWKKGLSQLAGDAADLIEWYKSGKVPSSAIDMVPPFDPTWTSWWCKPCSVEVYSIHCKHCGKTEKERS